MGKKPKIFEPSRIIKNPLLGHPAILRALTHLWVNQPIAYHAFVFHLSGLTPAQASKEMGISLNTFHARNKRARRAFSKFLKLSENFSFDDFKSQKYLSRAEVMEVVSRFPACDD